MNEILFLDTNVLLEDIGSFEGKNFAISSKTLEELENIKASRTKSEDVKAAARKVSRWLADHHGEYQVVIFTESEYNEYSDLGVDFDNPDVIICACAAYLNKEKDVKFVTHDLNCRIIAEQIFGLNVEWFEDKEENEYTGFKEVSMSDEEMAYFYEHQNENMYDLLVNQYLIVKNVNNEIVDSYRWDGESYQTTKIGNIKSDILGPLKPYKGDIYQQCLINSFINNKITMVRGKAGVGKTHCAIYYLVYLLEKHKIDRIVFFTNTVPTINTAKLGFYPGSRDEKLRESSIGNILASKFGDSFMVERLMSENKLVLLPMCDIRGYDTSGTMNTGVLITEAQNLNVELMKLALQRIGENSICIIDGDYNAQVDSVEYGGRKNGMRRLSEVFRGQDIYGEVELQNIYRSKIAELAEMM